LKAGIRQVGVLTAPLRTDPDFLIIGAKRGGTTSLYYDLLAHPAMLRLFPPPVPGLKGDATKGVHYFDSNYFRGARWYRSYMPTEFTRQRVSRRAGTRAVVGEASPYYLFHPAAAGRAHAALPDARIILLLRDPVMRTYSHWKERRRAKAETLDFDAALAAEPTRLAGEEERLRQDPHYYSYAWEQQSYLTQSLYARALRPWVDLYGRDRIFVAASEEYYAAPGAVLARIHAFLGLPEVADTTGVVRNAAAGKPLPDDVRAHLQERFREPNVELRQLLGCSLPWT